MKICKARKIAWGIFFLVLKTGVVCAQESGDYAVNLTTSISESPASTTFQWESISGESPITVMQKSKDSANRDESLTSLPAKATGYTDTGVETGLPASIPHAIKEGSAITIFENPATHKIFLKAVTPVRIAAFRKSYRGMRHLEVIIVIPTGFIHLFG